MPALRSPPAPLSLCPAPLHAPSNTTNTTLPSPPPSVDAFDEFLMQQQHPLHPSLMHAYPPYPDYTSDNSPPPSAGRRYRSAPAKTFQCAGYGDCRMVFSRSEHLARHIRKHTGERPFTCHCTKQFSRLDNLRQHAQTVHASPQEKALNESMMRALTSVNASMMAGVRGRRRFGAAASPAPCAPYDSASSSSPYDPSAGSYDSAQYDPSASSQYDSAAASSYESAVYVGDHHSSSSSSQYDLSTYAASSSSSGSPYGGNAYDAAPYTFDSPLAYDSPPLGGAGYGGASPYDNSSGSPPLGYDASSSSSYPAGYPAYAHSHPPSPPSSGSSAGSAASTPASSAPSSASAPAAVFDTAKAQHAFDSAAYDGLFADSRALLDGAPPIKQEVAADAGLAGALLRIKQEEDLDMELFFPQASPGLYASHAHAAHSQHGSRQQQQRQEQAHQQQEYAPYPSPTAPPPPMYRSHSQGGGSSHSHSQGSSPASSPARAAFYGAQYLPSPPQSPGCFAGGPQSHAQHPQHAQQSQSHPGHATHAQFGYPRAQAEMSNAEYYAAVEMRMRQSQQSQGMGAAFYEGGQQGGAQAQGGGGGGYAVYA
ncbi:hypothetical protein C8J57DRAFT_1493114 [Mycena rebaudengoi]|nr:hypothetical protein C8J57DRAFT_1493114 [Mycena rebaudengoi]